MDAIKIIDTLRQSQLFSHLNEKELEGIAAKAKTRQYFANDVIVWQGQPSTALFFIVNGIVAVKDKDKLLAYLMPGNTFGEVGILENQARSATVSALSEVDVLVIQRDDFLYILHHYSSVGIELARLLGRYLVQSNRRLSKAFKDTKLIFVFDSDKEDGGTSFTTLLAEKLVEKSKQPTALFEYPNPWRLLNGFQLPPGSNIYHHSAGYDILLPKDEGYLPTSTRATLMLDQLRPSYDNIVIQVRDVVDEGVKIMLDQANQIILLAAPNDKGIRHIEYLQRKLKGKVRPEETPIITVLNRCLPEYQTLPSNEIADFEIPYLKDFPTFELPQRKNEAIPEPLELILENCVERLDRNHSIGIFIPTTIDVDQASDTTEHMDKTMSFMAERFGGATCKVASGVWHSEKLGLVGEVVYIVHSYLSQSDMNRYLDEVVDYIKELKRELKQEAMALEVNHKLTLI